MLPFPSHFHQHLQENPMAIPGLGREQDLLLDGHAQNTSPGQTHRRHPDMKPELTQLALVGSEE